MGTDIVWHKHHIVPKHAGGTDDPSNILKCNAAMHAFMHEQRYREVGDEYDRIAADALRKRIGKEEAIRQAQIYSNQTRIVSEETRQKMSASHKGRIPWNKGKSIDNGWTGRKHTDETKLKISESKKGKPSPLKGLKTGKRANNAKDVITPDGRMTVQEAMAFYGIGRSTVTRWVKNKEDWSWAT